MNKEQQIEEIANITYDKIKKTFGAKFKDIAEAIYNTGYCKIDENCAVITKAELKEYKRQAVKEFAERLKEKAHKGAFRDPITYKFIERDYTITESELNELLKEYEK